LPSDQVLWLVLGMALFRNEPISEVARRLNICAQGLASDSLLARSGVSQARQRLGAEPLQWLFRQTGECWGKERYPGDDWHGLPVLAADGAVLRTPDTPALREHFGSGNTSTDRQTPFPMMRLVALMNVRSHVMLDAQPSPYRRSEIRLADEFRDIKSSLQHNAVTLRSKTVALIYQEVWGLLLGYNVIRREASQAAVAHGQEPARVRFKFAYQYIAAQLIVMAAAQPLSRTGARLAELRAGIGNLLLDRRPRPSRPRSVKISKTRYPVNRKADPLK
jgi:hypothetical protein